MKNVLLLTNHLFTWAGSETIIIELAEHFREIGFDVSIYANFQSAEFLSPLIDRGIRIIAAPRDVRICEFDLVYCQHQVLSLFAGQLLRMAKSERGPRIVYGHLSPYQPLEFPGAIIEDCFADAIICNSEETKRRMIEFGLDRNRLQLFANPAPESFFQTYRPARKNPTVLVVSNHLPSEVKQALDGLVEAGFRVRFFGDEYVNHRVTPIDLEMSDMVVTIGKTVQYAIASERPVYVYDHFGGPGWLSSENFDRAAEFNFSGRCTGTKKSSELIKKEILEGYPYSSSNVMDLSMKKEDFRLTKAVQDIFLESPIDSKARYALYRLSKRQKLYIYREYFVYRLRLVAMRCMRQMPLLGKVISGLVKRLT